MPWFWGKKDEEYGDDMSSPACRENDNDDDLEDDNEKESPTVVVEDAYDETDNADESHSHASSDSEEVEEEVVATRGVEKIDSQQPPEMSTHSEITNHDDDVSMIDANSGVDSLDDDFLDSSSSEEDEEQSQPGVHDTTTRAPYSDEETTDDDKEEGDDDEQVLTSFWEKQSLLILAAEHDRVDILRSILTDDDDDKDRLMNSGIPPLHLSITFGSVHATVALLRMGADPSVRPNTEKILEEQKEQPEDSKVEIPNLQRFDGASAWELTFGNQAYEASKSYKKSKSWSIFDSSSPSTHKNGQSQTSTTSEKVIKPVDMPPSKREGIRHAFTAEALRSVGGDEVERLRQLLESGMPASIDIGGKDLYGWAVEMGALKCEELLRPSEAAKYDSGDENDGSHDASQMNGESHSRTHKTPQEDGSRLEKQSSSFVIHRPTEETVPELQNRLDELDSLAVALSTCLDNLAEEVSVCHGLLLMGGGATALASHVKSLKALKAQKLDQLQDEHALCQTLERDLTDLVHSSGEIGREIASKAPFQLFSRSVASPIKDNKEEAQRENDVARKGLLAQVAASENKIRKLRASIADLSEENARDMVEVHRRGLEGGINLVRGLREEIRDLDFQLGEFRSMTAELRTKISMIYARVPTQKQMDRTPLKGSPEPANAESNAAQLPPSLINHSDAPSNDCRQNLSSSMLGESYDMTSLDEAEFAAAAEVMRHIGHNQESGTDTKTNAVGALEKRSTPSQKIATGDSTAIAVIQPGNRGFFTVDLWQVILRIIGFDRAAYRRGVQVASTQPNVMIV